MSTTNQRLSDRDRVVSAQQRWANECGHTTDAQHYLRDYRLGLRAAPSDLAAECYARGSGSEMRDGATRPAKMRALHSSSALVVNAFDYWSGRGTSAVLGRGLGFDQPIELVGFETKLRTGLGGTPPNLDATLRCEDGTLIGVESKFTEWLQRKKAGKGAFNRSYFPDDAPSLWEKHGLAASQRLAREIHDDKRQTQFTLLDVGQLLKHALGLASRAGVGHFALLYLYFDVDSKVGERHRDEIAAFQAEVGSELRFHALSYQRLIERLTNMAVDVPESDREQYRSYVDYLRTRYARSLDG